MQLFIMRHGQAHSYAAKDSLRQLTPYGIEQSANAGQWFEQKGIDLDYALVSPYLRAQQTFATVQEQIKMLLPNETLETLIPGGRSYQVYQRIIELISQGKQSILIVSHLPLVGDLVNEFCAEMLPMFSTADVAHIDIDEQTFLGVYKGMI